MKNSKNPCLLTASSFQDCPHRAQQSNSLEPLQLMFAPDMDVNRGIAFKELLFVAGLKKSRAHELKSPKSSKFDPTFPKGFRHGNSSRGRLVFWYPDVISWLQTRAAVSRKTN